MCGLDNFQKDVFFCQFREVYEQKADQLTESRLDAESNINITC